MKITFSQPSLPGKGTIVAGILEGKKLTPTARDLDERTSGAISKAISASRFTGKANELLDVMAPAGIEAERILLLGLGSPDKLDAASAETLGGTIFGHLGGSGQKVAAVAIDGIEGGVVDAVTVAAHLGFGAELAAYRFDKYRTSEKADQKPSLAELQVMVDDAAKARRTFGPLQKVADGVRLARDLVWEPANVLYPETLAEQARQLADLGVEVQVLEEERLRELGMGALLGVAQGSTRPPYVVVMHWRGSERGANKQPVAFVGKGVTFDTGGISLKPAGGMEDMKWDMGGAAAVIGLMKALAGRKAKVNAVGIVGLVENMPSGTAQRPGDVVRSMSGQTIEVINTDAEGRLVLADVIWYVRDRFKPRAIIDLATLTGAIIISLGHHNAGLFSNDDALADRLLASGNAVGETLWRMPLGEEYAKQIKSDIADIKNVGGREGGSVTAAEFLKKFVGDTPWAHLDIAGVTWSSKAKPTVPKGGTGFGVRLLDRYVADACES